MSPRKKLLLDNPVINPNGPPASAPPASNASGPEGTTTAGGPAAETTVAHNKTGLAAAAPRAIDLPAQLAVGAVEGLENVRTGLWLPPRFRLDEYRVNATHSHITNANRSHRLCTASNQDR